MDLFEFLNDLTISKKDLDPTDTEKIKEYQPYIINRFISMVNLYLPFVNEMNQYPDIPKETHYRFYKNLLPKRKQFFKYIKKGKDLSEKEKEYICEYFECGKKEAERYITVLSEDNIKKIINIYS